MGVSIIMGILSPLLGIVVPALVAQAEAAIQGSGKGPEKRQWVIDAVAAILKPLEAILPSWAQKVEGPVEDLVDWVINMALDKVGMK